MKKGIWVIAIVIIAIAVLLCVNETKKKRASEGKYIVSEDMVTKIPDRLLGVPAEDTEEAGKVTESVSAEKQDAIKETPVTKTPDKKKTTPTVTPREMSGEETREDVQQVTEREPKATPYVLAQENQPGVQTGWGKIKDTIVSATLNKLPDVGSGSVKTENGQGDAVIVTPETLLMLYGVYEGEKEKVYRHVGVTYADIEYYGYILADRIVECTDEGAELPVEEPTENPAPEQEIVLPYVPSGQGGSVGTTVKTTPTPKASATPTATPKLTATPTPTPKPTATPTPTPTPTATPTPVLERVVEGIRDYSTIPDKYNTGCSGALTKINSEGVVNGVEYTWGNDGMALVIDWYYRNQEAATEIVISNVDFSEFDFAIRNAARVEVKRTVRFVNCKFGAVSVEVDQENAQYLFTNCSLVRFNGSNSMFERCFFGGSSGDAMNPFRNVTVKNSYFCGFPQWNEKGTHTDAMQVYGKENVDAINIKFSNCRIEIPVIKTEGRKTLINACLMVQLEYSNARNFTFENCIINGGGYSIYAWDKNKGWSLDNIVFRNISVGRGRLYGSIYPNVSDGVTFENITETAKLYVASVWKDSFGKVHLSVTNDTAEDRTLLIVTENGKQEVTIPCKATAEAAGAKEYYDLPIDLDIGVNDSDSGWVVCYDGAETAENQIRFVNWNGETVYREVK